MLIFQVRTHKSEYPIMHGAYIRYVLLVFFLGEEHGPGERADVCGGYLYFVVLLL